MDLWFLRELRALRGETSFSENAKKFQLRDLMTGLLLKYKQWIMNIS